MAELIDYLAWRGDIDFSAVPPNEVDSLIFSQIIYIDFDSVLPSGNDARPISLLAATKSYLKTRRGEKKTSLGALIPREIILLATHAAKSKRFGSLYISDFVNDINEEDQSQFCAMTFDLGGAKYVVFRGTDDTLVGWKESLNMSFMHPIPAQSAALEYLTRVCDGYEGDIYVGGHSKGGNLAVFSAVEAPDRIKEHIVAVYNNDGPGFTREFIESEKYLAIKDRLLTFVPESSVVGMLLEHEESYFVVKSTQNGIFQHNGLSWEVMGGEFIRLDAIAKGSKKIDVDLKRWLSTMSNEERKGVLDAIYDILIATDAKTLSDLSADKLKLIKAWSSLDDESKTLIKRCIKALINARKDKGEDSAELIPAEPAEDKSKCAKGKKCKRKLKSDGKKQK